MGEELRFVITEVNKMFGKDYNMISFDSLPLNELLQVVCNVLQKLEVLPITQVEKDIDLAIIKIIDALQSIKYTPAADITPNMFREGIALGKRLVIIPVLFWLLSNPNQVKTRAYLSRFVEKIELPQEALDDYDIQDTMVQYEKLIQEFWKSYLENKKQKKAATDTKQLQKDIERMSHDKTKLFQRIEQQREKVDSIPNKEALLVVAKAYRNEYFQQKKLKEQLQDQKELGNQMDNQIKELRENLAQKQTRNSVNFQPLQEITNELRANTILVENQLSQELTDAKKNVERYELVAVEPEPSSDEIDKLSVDVEKISQEIKSIVERQLTQTNTSDDQLGPFRNQAKMVANKKQELSIDIMDVKESINNINVRITDKQNVLLTLVGGPIRHGDELRQYVAKLRERSTIYKEYRSQLQAMSNESNVLGRTLEILKQLDTSIEDVLKNKRDVGQASSEEEVPSDVAELKHKLKKLTTDADTKRAEAAQVREDVVRHRTAIDDIQADYNMLKTKFEAATGIISTELRALEEEIASIEKEIETAEDTWKTLRREIERKEEMLVRLSEDIINSADDLDNVPTQVDVYKKRLDEFEEEKRKLKSELDKLEKQKREGKNQLKILKGISKLLKDISVQ